MRLLGKLLYQKNNKLKFILLILLFCLAILDITLIIFDIVQFILVESNRASLSTFFVPFNVISIILNAGCLIYLIVVVALSLKKVKSKVKRENNNERI